MEDCVRVNTYKKHGLETVKVSLLVPCYNQARHIGGVIKAVQAQTRPPDEVIIVDDASTDDSLRVIAQFPVTLQQHKNNLGPAAARNTALKVATGDILLYLDADAYPRPGLIEKMILAYQALDIQTLRTLGGIGGRGLEVHPKSLADRWRALHASQNFGTSYKKQVPFLFGLCASYRRDVLEEVGGFDDAFPINAGEDFELGYRMRKAGYHLHYDPALVVEHYHADTLESLMRNQANWYYWGYIAKRKNHAHPWTLWAGALKRLFSQTLSDLFLHQDGKLAHLSLDIFSSRLSALYKATFSR